MKILIVSTSDIQGGAAKAAYRLHRSLLEAEVDSTMLVQSKSSDDFTVIGLSNNKIQKGIHLLRAMINQLPVKFYQNRTKTPFSAAWLPFNGIVDKINDIKPDIVHLHWICAGMMTIEDIARIKVPIVWSLHDMWAFTGGCHYDEECGAYENVCGKCKVLGSDKEKDLSRRIFSRKQKVFNLKKEMAIVGLSKWIHNASKRSTLLKNNKHINLPNPIDVTLYKPLDKEKSRRFWHLPKDKKLVLFGAMGATSDPRKGFDELSKAMQKLDDRSIEFVVFGSKESKKSHNFGFKTYYLGNLADDESLVTLYSAVDVMVVPSIQENLSNAIMESLACATPVVGFDIGGNSDMVVHLKNGYLAKPFDTNELAYGIEWILNHEKYEKLCQNAREKVLKEFDSKIVVKRYMKLYEEVLYGK